MSKTHISITVLLSVSFSCYTPKLSLPEPERRVTGSEFYRIAAAFDWKQRDSLAVKEILAGNMPDFLKKFVEVDITYLDSATGNTIRGNIYVMSDYLAVGTNDDWARIPLTPLAGQKIADSLSCFLPTRRICDVIYKAAKVKLEPVPMYAFRDSTPTMYHHHLIVEGQRRSRKGLIAGIKKDVVISGKISRDSRPNRVAIYGWHLLSGKPIQPLYTGHVNWYADYSHGIRLIYKMMKVEGKWTDYKEVLAHPLWRKLICDEEYCDFYKYPY